MNHDQIIELTQRVVSLIEKYIPDPAVVAIIGSTKAEGLVVTNIMDPSRISSILQHSAACITPCTSDAISAELEMQFPQHQPIDFLCHELERLRLRLQLMEELHALRHCQQAKWPQA